MAALEKELERYRQAEKKSESAHQETDAPSKAAYKLAIKALGQLQTTGLFADDHPAIKTLTAPTTTRQSRRLQQAWTRQRRPVTNPCPSARGFEQARTRSPCMSETSKRPTIECWRLSRAFWPLSRAWNSTEPRSWRSRSRCKSDGTTWSSFTDKLQLKRRTDPRPLSCKSWSQTESPSTCPKRQGTDSGKLQTSTRRNARQRQQERRQPHTGRKKRWSFDEFGNLDDREDPVPDPTAEARIQASIDEPLQAQTRGDPERLAVLRAQMARDLSSPVPKKRPKQG